MFLHEYPKLSLRAQKALDKCGRGGVTCKQIKVRIALRFSAGNDRGAVSKSTARQGRQAAARERGHRRSVRAIAFGRAAGPPQNMRRTVTQSVKRYHWNSIPCVGSFSSPSVSDCNPMVRFARHGVFVFVPARPPAPQHFSARAGKTAGLRKIFLERGNFR